MDDIDRTVVLDAGRWSLGQPTARRIVGCDSRAGGVQPDDWPGSNRHARSSSRYGVAPTRRWRCSSSATGRTPPMRSRQRPGFRWSGVLPWDRAGGEHVAGVGRESQLDADTVGSRRPRRASTALPVEPVAVEEVAA